MGLLDFFRRQANSTSPKASLHPEFTADGVHFSFARPLASMTPEALLDATQDAGPEDSILGAYLAQLAGEGKCQLDSGGALVAWSRVYELLASSEHQGAIQLLNLPPLGDLRPILTCSGTLSEPSFDLELEGWADSNKPIRIERFEGAVATADGRQLLLPASTWATISELSAFRQRGPEGRTQHKQELAWGRIRQHADRAGALYTSPYLETTYVVTPQSLRLPLTKEDTPFGRVLTVAPTFDGAPDGWLTAFDGFNSVQSHYDLTRGTGRVRVVISEPVRQVLSVIKREMKGRRVAGSKAEKFIHNPWAFLGEAAHEVLREEDFQADRADAGSLAAVFSVVARFDAGRIESIDLCVTEHFSDGATRASIRHFASPDELDEFTSELQAALRDDRERFPWHEYDLSIDAESTVQLEQAQQLLHLWRTQPAQRISMEDVYELASYSGRVEGIGAARPIYVPVFQKPSNEQEDGENWLPSDLTPMVRITLQGHEGQVLVPLTRQWVDDFEKKVDEAQKNGDPEVTDPVLPTPLATHQARSLVDSFRTMLNSEDRVKADGSKPPKDKRPPRETLFVKTNFHGVDYQEERRASLTLPADAAARLPKCLRAGIELKDHQRRGIAWFQHLAARAPVECRGALLADDMGLGKTVQLLCVLGSYYEAAPNAAPSVIFAPKSLLENWANEVQKFFTPSFPELLVLYGDELKSRKQPLGLIDSQLQSKGIVELLKPGWAGTAKVIVTTYEVLTSFEFSFAKQPFAFVICDEAQRIKTPGTLVTLAAKKLKADFRVACTGTPVENSLADLWCLFDFVQPGLLGALEDFGKTYRRPIECETEEQQGALERLQLAIAPQTLRRTKLDIAAELPRKLYALKAHDEKKLRYDALPTETDRLEIALSEHQRILYKAGLKKLQDAAQEADGRKRARLSFGALHLMKAVCAEPYCLPGSKFLIDKGGRDAHLENSPKLRWLLERLEEVRQANEKAIIFTELREAQAALYYFLRETFGLKPFIINGDSQGRQAYIDKFSASEGFDVIILSTLAAGAGLNVTAANHVFHFTRAWNPSKEAQATDRAFRIGQRRDVIVYCPTVVADDFNTFEVRLDQLLKRKAGLAGSTLDNGALVAMLNGTGGDASITELFGDDENGEALPKRYLTMDDVDRMDGLSFEVFCCLLWEKRGYQALLTPKRGGDGGVDVVALRGSEGDLLQCKSSVNAKIGWDAIKEVSTGAAQYQARYAGTRLRRIAVTNQEFTSAAIAQAESNKAELVTRKVLAEYLGAHPVTNHEMDEALHHWLPSLKDAA